MAKQQKGKTKHKSFGDSAKGIRPAYCVFNPVVERAVRTILLRNSNNMHQLVAYELPVTGHAGSSVPVVVGMYHNGFEELLIDPQVNSHMAMQGFNYRRILEEVTKVTDFDGAPLSWLEGTKHDLEVPLCTTLGALIHIIQCEYDNQRIVEAAEYKAAQLTKKGKV